MLDRIALRLRILRETVTGVQADAARAAGVATYTWNRYEQGTSKPDLIALASFADAFDVTTDFVLRGRLEGLRPEVMIRVLARDHGELARAGIAVPDAQSPGGRTGGRSTARTAAALPGLPTEE